LALSKREAARLLGIDRGATLDHLIRTGRVHLVPWGRGHRIPLEDVQRVAREGFTFHDKPVRTRLSRRRTPGLVDPDALRRLDVERLGEVAP
jgi:hypothetical protein